MVDIKKYLVKEDCNLRDALERLDITGEKILLLVDHNGVLKRTVTDGDLRRMLLKGLSLDDKLNLLPEKNPVKVTVDIDDTTALQEMNKLEVDQLPVVDGSGRPVNIFLRRIIDSRILLSTPHLGEYEMGFIEEAFKSNWIAPVGPNIDAFEYEMSEYLGVKHAAALSSGTAALHLALDVVGVQAGDYVFCSSFTFVASANPILYLGAIPVFIDSEPNTWNMSPNALEQALIYAEKHGQLPRAVIVVNLYGQNADMDSICNICDRYGVPIIEDAAESLGATYKGRASGTLGDIGVFSFNGNKIITTSGGGMLVSNNEKIVKKARFLATQARENSPWYEHKELGYNYRMSNILAGIGRGQLKVLDQRIEARRRVFSRYRDSLKHIDFIDWMPEPELYKSTRWLSVCTIDDKSDLSPGSLIESLASIGIEARYVWKPMHMQPLFEKCKFFLHKPESCFSEKIFNTGICLPSGSNMTEEQQDRIIYAIKDLFSDTMIV